MVNSGAINKKKQLKNIKQIKIHTIFIKIYFFLSRGIFAQRKGDEGRYRLTHTSWNF